MPKCYLLSSEQLYALRRFPDFIDCSETVKHEGINHLESAILFAENLNHRQIVFISFEN